jgi:hypothetical protein
MVPVIMLVERGGLSLLKIEGSKATTKIHEPTEKTISCQGINI